MRRILIAIAVLLCSSLSINAQINDNHSYLAQSMDYQVHKFSVSQVESMYANAQGQYNIAGYKESSKWKVGKGLLIGGVSCLGLVGLSFGAVWIAADSGNWDNILESSMVFAWSAIFVGSAGLALTIAGGAMMAAAKNRFTATIDLGTPNNPHTYAQLGLTRTGNIGLSLNF